MDKIIKNLQQALFRTLIMEDMDSETDWIITSFMENSLLDLQYLLLAKEQEFKDSDDIHSVYMFCTERNMFWKGSHGYTRHIGQAQLFNKEVAKELATPYSKSKLVYFDF